MLTSVWREILNDSISGDKLAGGTVYPPFDLVYVKCMCLGSPTHNYPVIFMNDEDSAFFGLGWQNGYGKIWNYMFTAEAIESPILADGAPIIKIKGRSDNRTMASLTMDKATRCGIIYALQAGSTRFQIYPSGTSFMLDKFVFGSNTFDNNWLDFKFQSLVNSLFRGRMVVQGDLEVQSANFYCNGQVSAASFFTYGTIHCNLETGYDIKTAIDPMFAWYKGLKENLGFVPEDLLENEIEQIQAIDNYVLRWADLETVNQNLSTAGNPEFSSVKTDTYANSSGVVEMGKWYDVSIGLDASITNGIGVTPTGSAGPSVSGTPKAQWCWNGDRTVTIRGYICIEYPNPADCAISMAFAMKGTFAWAHPDSDEYLYSLATWQDRSSTHDRHVFRAYQFMSGIGFQRLLAASECRHSFDFQITYTVEGPIPTA